MKSLVLWSAFALSSSAFASPSYVCTVFNSLGGASAETQVSLGQGDVTIDIPGRKSVSMSFNPLNVDGFTGYSMVLQILEAGTDLKSGSSVAAVTFTSLSDQLVLAAGGQTQTGFETFNANCSLVSE